MYLEQKQTWDQNSREYQKSIHEDKTGVFAYEKTINIPSFLNLFLDHAENVLDLGCGDGYLLSLLVQKFPHVFAIDSSKEMLKIAQKSAPRVQFIQHDLDKPFPKFGNKFDLITAHLTFMYINDLNNVARSCHQILTKGGVLLISITHPFSWLYKSFLSQPKDADTFDPLFQGYYSEIRITDTIAENDRLNFIFINRTLETYINTFTTNGFLLEAVSEPEVPLTFLLKYPWYQAKMNRPLRLNLKLINQ